MGGSFEVIARGVPAGPRQLRPVGSQARRPARAGADVDSGDQGGRHRPRARRSPSLPGSRVHDEILPPAGAPRPSGVGVARPTNNAGGLEGGVTNGEDLRVTGYMKPIATLMKPLRSVDLTTMAESPAAIERSDVCAVPAAAVVGEAMVALVLADAVAREVRRRLGRRAASPTGGRSATRTAARFAARRAAASATRHADDPTDPQVRRRTSCTSRPRPVDAITPEIDRLIDDMIETMYAAPGIGLAAPQVGVPLRIFVVDLSVGRDPDGPDRHDQPGVRRARRHAARRRRLPERARLQRHRRPADARRRQGARSRRQPSSSIEGTGLLARAFQHEMDHLDGTLFVDRLRGIKRDLIVRKIRKLTRAGKW